MDIKQYWRVLRDHWLLVLLCALVGGGAGFALTERQSPRYTSSLQLFVSTKVGSDSNAAYEGSLFGQQRVKSYADIVSSDRVVDAVRQQLGLQNEYTVEDLQGEISASVPTDTVLVNVTVVDGNAQRAADIANAVGKQFGLLVNEIETPLDASTSIKVSVVRPAKAAGAPSSPDRNLNIALGIIIGLAVGIGAAVLRETLDTSVSEREEASESSKAPVLVALAEDEKVRRRPLIVSEDPFSPRAEAFRQLRTNIRFLSVDEKLRSIVVTSASQGEGKTTVASNLAIALAQSGEQVILVDADLRRPRVAELLGLNGQVGLTNVLLGLTHLDNALVPWREGLPLRVLASGEIPPNPSEILGSHRMQQLLQELLQRANVVVFDSPPLLPVTDAAILSNITDGALLVVRAGKTKRDALTSAAEAVRHAGSEVLGVVMNRATTRQAGVSYRYGFSPSEALPNVRLDPDQPARGDRIAGRQ